MKRLLCALAVVLVVASFVVVPVPEPAAAFAGEEVVIPTAALGTTAVGAGAVLTSAVTLSGGVVALAAGGVAAVAYGTVQGLNWLFPSQDPPGPIADGNNWSLGVETFSNGQSYFTAGASELPNFGNTNLTAFRLASGQYTGDATLSNVQHTVIADAARPALNANNNYTGTAKTARVPFSSQSLVGSINVTAACEANPTCGFVPGETLVWTARSGSTGSFKNTPVYGAVRANSAVDVSGLRRQMRTQLTCVGGGTLQTPLFTGPEFWDKDKTANPDSYPAPVGNCPAGTKLTGIDTSIRTIGGATYPVPIYDKPLVEWDIPTGTTTGTTPTQPALDECYGNLDCTLETVPATGTLPQRCLWGGNPVPLSWCEETTTVKLQAQPVTTTTQVVTPTTVVNPSTSTSTTSTTVVTTTTIAPCLGGSGCVPCPQGQTTDCVPDTDGTASECWPSGWGWLNPAEWVLKPIKCAFSWLFVPDGAAWDNVLADLEGHQSEPPVQWIAGGVSTVQESNIGFVRWRNSTSLPCPNIMGERFCVKDLDTDSLPSWFVIAAVISLYLLLAVSVAKFL